jgi:hypothetical protein
MRIVESTDFGKDWPRLLSLGERRALDLLLADDPAIGSAEPGLPGLLRLDYAGAVIHYAVSPDMAEVFLLGIGPQRKSAAPPTKEERSRLRRALDAMVAGGVISGARSAGRWAWERIKEWLEGTGG